MRAVLLLGVLSAGCTAVLGLDERELAPDAAEAAVDSSIAEDDSATPDSSLLDSSMRDGSMLDSSMFDSSMFDSAMPDSAMPDVPVIVDTGKDTAMDTAPMDAGGCPFFGLMCTGLQQCVVSRAADHTYSVACETPPVGGTNGANCVAVGSSYKCAPGFACRDRYPSGTICEPLCTAHSSCAAPYPRCEGVTWTGTAMGTTTMVCNLCDPNHYLQGCLPNHCAAISATKPPECRPSSDFGSATAGAACSSTVLCNETYVCHCGTDFGLTGCAGKTGTCVEVCDTTSSCPTGKTCKPLVAGSLLQGCM